MDIDTSAAMVATFQIRSILKGLTSTLGNERPYWPFSHFPWNPRHAYGSRVARVDQRQMSILLILGVVPRTRIGRVRIAGVHLLLMGLCVLENA
jgi:hypothetical protein